MRAVGVVEPIVGLAGLGRLFGYAPMAWLPCITLDLITSGQHLEWATG
jgi:hypothetical protein